jgi:hypothetical protein
LSGKENIIGETITIPREVKMLATAKSITKNGRKITKPIKKPVLISEIANAGIKTVNGTSSRA